MDTTSSATTTQVPQASRARGLGPLGQMIVGKESPFAHDRVRIERPDSVNYVAPLFDEEIQAWAKGPVVPALYIRHRGHFAVTKGFFGGNPEKLSAEQKDVMDRVLSFYGPKDPQWLSGLTHLESPWKDARTGMQPDE